MLKLLAWGLSNSKSGLAAHYRRLRTRIGVPKTINATARKKPLSLYNMLKNKTSYISQSQEEYDNAHKQRILKQLQQKAGQFSLELCYLEGITLKP
ncbi:MAG: hypothetical protein KAG45_07025 [Methyloprofundus sp.]|nr:hypothetical protein [Methyloprofundus sp.]